MLCFLCPEWLQIWRGLENQLWKCVENLRAFQSLWGSELALRTALCLNYFDCSRKTEKQLFPAVRLVADSYMWCSYPIKEALAEKPVRRVMPLFFRVLKTEGRELNHFQRILCFLRSTNTVLRADSVWLLAPSTILSCLIGLCFYFTFHQKWSLLSRSPNYNKSSELQSQYTLGRNFHNKYKRSPIFWYIDFLML